MSNRFTQKSVANSLGVPVKTLLEWEKQFATIQVDRTDPDSPVYDRETVNLLEQINALLKQGEKIAELAERVTQGIALPRVESRADSLPLSVLQLIENAYDSLIQLDLVTSDEIFGHLEDQLSAIQRLDAVHDRLLERLGQDWASNKISIAQEHFASSYLRRRLFSLLQRRNISLQPTARRVVCTTLLGEKHEGGLLIVANHFQMRGWAVYYLGTEIPIEELVKINARIKPDLVCLSFAHSKVLKENAQKLKKIEEPIFVGGCGCSPTTVSDQFNGNVHVIRSRGQFAVEEVLQRLQSNEPI